MIAKLDYQSTHDFLDYSVAVSFKPVTLTYSLELQAFLREFGRVENKLTNEVRLRALEEYEKLRKSVLALQKNQ